MSSILDALKKLEAEKVEARQREADRTSDHVEERELVGRHIVRPRNAVRITPAVVALGFLVIAALLVGTSVGVSMLLVSRSNETTVPEVAVNVAPTTLVQPPPAVAPPEPVAVAPSQPPATEPAVRNSTPKAENPESAPPAKPETTVAEPAPSTPPPPDAAVPEIKEPAPKVETPEPVAPVAPPVAVAARAPETPTPVDRPQPETQAPEPKVRNASNPWEGPMMRTAPPARTSVPEARHEPEVPVAAPAALDIEALAKHPLRETDKRRLGLVGLQINMLQPVNKKRPVASAIINLNTVYVGEIVPRTTAKLVAVDGVKGIIIEMLDTKERFYVPF